LDYAVLYRWNPERSGFAVALGNVHPADRMRSIGIQEHTCLETVQPFGTEVLEGETVNTGCLGAFIAGYSIQRGIPEGVVLHQVKQPVDPLALCRQDRQLL
jgi:hypothetical protein